MPRSILISKSAAKRNGGVEKQTLRFAHYFAEKGWHVTLATSDAAPKQLHPAVDVVVEKELPKRGSKRLIAFDRFVHHVQGLIKPDVTLGMERTTAQTHLRLGNGIHAAFLERRKQEASWLKRLTFAMNPLHRTILDLERQAFSSPDLKVAIAGSQMVQREAEHYYGLKNVQVIYNGVEWQEMEEAFSEREEKRKKLSNQLKQDRERHLLLFVGHGFRRKGLLRLMQALQRMGKRASGAALLVVGSDKEEAMFRKMRLPCPVTFFGEVKEMRPFYQLADTFVLPTLYDPCANATLEALSMGLFAITTDSNGAHELLTPSSGKVITHEEELPQALEAAFEMKPDRKTIRDSMKQLDFYTQLSSYAALLSS